MLLLRVTLSVTRSFYFAFLKHLKFLDRRLRRLLILQGLSYLLQFAAAHERICVNCVECFFVRA